MTELTRTDVTTVLLEAAQLRPRRRRFELCQEAVELADRLGDDRLRFASRLWLVEAACQQDHPEIAITAMAWCMGMHESDPKTYLDGSFWHVKDGSAMVVTASLDLHWALKSILWCLPDFAEIGREQIEAAFEQASGLYRRRGLNQHPIHRLRALVARDMGDHDLAAEERRRWRETARDRGADCAACELNHEVEFLLWDGEDEAAVKLAAPLVAGTLRCQGGEALIMHELLLPLLRLDRKEEAESIRTGAQARMRRDVAGHVVGFSICARYLVATGRFRSALEDAILPALPHALGKRVDLVRLRFFSAFRCLLRLVLERTASRWIRKPLPEAVPVRRRERGQAVEEVLEWVEARMEEHLTALAERNGNDWMTRHFDLELEEIRAACWPR